MKSIVKILVLVLVFFVSPLQSRADYTIYATINAVNLYQNDSENDFNLTVSANSTHYIEGLVMWPTCSGSDMLNVLVYFQWTDSGGNYHEGSWAPSAWNTYYTFPTWMHEPNTTYLSIDTNSDASNYIRGQVRASGILHNTLVTMRELDNSCYTTYTNNGTGFYVTANANLLYSSEVFGYVSP